MYSSCQLDRWRSMLSFIDISRQTFRHYRNGDDLVSSSLTPSDPTDSNFCVLWREVELCWLVGRNGVWYKLNILNKDSLLIDLLAVLNVECMPIRCMMRQYEQS